MSCKHSIVTNQKSALPPGTKMAREDMQICCICGQLRSQQWGPWHEPVNVKERTMSTEGKTEKQKGSFNEVMLAVTIVLALAAVGVITYLGYFTGPTCGGLCG